MRHFFLSIIIAVLFSSPSTAHEYVVQDIFINHPYSHPTPPDAKTTGEGYAAFTNHGKTMERLTDVRADFATASLRQTLADGRKIELQEIKIPPGETIVLAPKGIYISFDNIARPFAIGDKLNVTLIFARAGAVTLEFWVEGRTTDTSVLPQNSTPTELKIDKGKPIDHVAITDHLRTKIGTESIIAPITILGTAAVVGWQIKDKGGRAFLRKNAGQWRLVLLSGESLTTTAGLQAQKLSPAIARQMHDALKDAETGVPLDVRQRFDEFVGTIIVEKGAPR